MENVEVILSDFELHVDHIEVQQGEYFVVLGPSGAGKSILINTIAGIIMPRRGRITIGGRDVTREPPERRGVAIVPQNYALFPHMNVFENIAFGLKVRGTPKAEISRRVREIAELLGIDHLLERKPSQLSGGEQQRVALARALVINPEVLLLDEPLSALDPDTRVSALRLLRKITSKLGVTVVHVTHTLLEALYLGKRICYMTDGRVVSVFSPSEFLATEYAKPYVEELRLALQLLRPS